MEPKKSSSQPRAATKKSPPVAAGVESPLSSLLHPASHGVNGKGKEQELYAILFKGQNGSAQASITGNGKSQWSPARSRTTYSKDNKHPYDSVDTSSCFGSSVHYGGRDYYGNFAPKQSTEYNDYKAASKDPVTDSHGDWWQGIALSPKQSTEYNDYKAASKDPVTDSHGDWWQGSFNY